MYLICQQHEVMSAVKVLGFIVKASQFCYEISHRSVIDSEFNYFFLARSLTENMSFTGNISYREAFYCMIAILQQFDGNVYIFCSADNRR